MGVQLEVEAALDGLLLFDDEPGKAVGEGVGEHKVHFDRRLRQVLDLKVAPRLPQILCHQPPVAVRWFVLAAQ